MRTLHAGKKHNGEPRIVTLSDYQWLKLGFSDYAKPIKLGCGMSGCAYLPVSSSDSVVKLTTDARDAIVSYMLLQLEAKPTWVVPIYAVYRIKNVFAICAAKGENLPKEWIKAIDGIYNYTYDIDLEDGEWVTFYNYVVEKLNDMDLRNKLSKMKLSHDVFGLPIKTQVVETDDYDEVFYKRMRHALEVINEAILSLSNFGFSEWADFHSENFKLWGDKPVVVDLGLSKKDTDENIFNHPTIDSIPVLR